MYCTAPFQTRCYSMLTLPFMSLSLCPSVETDHEQINSLDSVAPTRYPVG